LSGVVCPDFIPAFPSARENVVGVFPFGPTNKSHTSLKGCGFVSKTCFQNGNSLFPNKLKDLLAAVSGCFHFCFRAMETIVSYKKQQLARISTGLFPVVSILFPDVPVLNC
jgi:hypothetical protein